MRVGDRVRVPGPMTGVLVGDIEGGKYVAGYSAAEWRHLGSGLLVETEEAGLIHYPDRQDVTAAEE